MKDTLIAITPAKAPSLETVPPRDAAIRVRGLVKTYRGGYPGGSKPVQALAGATFSVARGKIFSLLGPNGAGKSTTIKILTTLSRPDSGEAFICGINVLTQPAKVRRLIGYVAQRPASDPEATGFENLRLQGQLQGLRGTVLERRIDELLDRFNLKEAASRQARTLSGGMQRKLDVAMGLIHQPQVLILDEPTTGLDPEGRVSVWSEIARLSKSGLTILITTHYLPEAEHLAERIAIMDRGRIVVEGTPERLKSELRGDSVQIDLPPGAVFDRMREAMDCLPGVRDVVVDGYTIRARADQGATAVLEMLGALNNLGCKALSVRVASPSLDDVYFRHTGRSFAGVDGERP